MPTVWRTTKPDAALDYRCDRCGAAADTVHFVPWITRCEAVLFACPDHDPGGYWMSLKRLYVVGSSGESGLDHLMNKVHVEDAIGMFAERVDRLRIEADA